MRVLDIGCGVGDVTILAADLVGPRGRVIGIDRDATVIDAARQRLSDLGFSNVDLQQHDHEAYDGPGDFDAAVCRCVLIHQTDPVRLLKAVKALVRAGGVVAAHEMDPTRGVQSNPRVPLLHQLETLMLTAFSQMGTVINAGGVSCKVACRRRDARAASIRRNDCRKRRGFNVSAVVYGYHAWSTAAADRIRCRERR